MKCAGSRVVALSLNALFFNKLVFLRVSLPVVVHFVISSVTLVMRSLLSLCPSMKETTRV